MSDPTLATCDDEPWNAGSPASPPAPPVPHAPSVYHCVTRRIPIYSSPGVHAPFVYDVLGVSREAYPCDDCADLAVVEAWQEWEWCPRTSELCYLPRQCFDLCEACGDALRALPIGQRWQRSKKKAAVLARCIRALAAVGYTEAVEALRPLLKDTR